MNQDFELALDDCLRRLGNGKSSLGQCLALYPQFGAELRPLLETALRLQRGKQARPSGAARDRTRARLNEFIQTHPRQPRNVRLVPRLAFVLVTLALAVTFVGTAFAQEALPGQALYPLKISTERLWRAAAPDRVAVDLTIANRRADELLEMAGQKPQGGANQKAQAAAEAQGIAAYTDVLDRLSAETNGPDDSVILTVLEAHQKKFDHAGINVPKLKEIVQQSGHGQRQQGQGPNNSKP